MDVIQAEVIQQAIISLNLSFVVIIKSPVELPPRVYTISAQEVLANSTSSAHAKDILYRLLEEKVLADYNRLIEDFPIMDMFEDPDRYKSGLRIELKFLNPDGVPSMFRD